MPAGDSISRYDPSMEMFTVGATPLQMKMAQNVKGPNGKDTIETPQERTERLNPMKSIPADSRVPKAQVVRIAKAGRFIFFAVALPPFLLMYALPKWVALTVLPALLVPLERGAEHAKKLLQHIIKLFSEGVSLPFRNIFGRINWKTKGVEKENAPLLTYLQQRVVKPVVKVYKALAETYKRAVSAVLKPVKAAKEKLKIIAKEAEKVLDKATDKAAVMIKTVYQASVQPVLNFMIPKVKTAQQHAEKGFKWAKQNVEHFVKALQASLLPPLKAVQKAASDAKEWTSEKAAQAAHQIIQTAQPVINLFVPTVEFFKKQLSFGLRWFRQKPKEQLWKLHLKAQKFLKKIVPFIDDTLIWSIKRMRSMIDRLFGPFKKNFFLWFPFIPRLFNKGKGVIIQMFAWFKRVFALVKAALARIVRPIAEKFASAWNYAGRQVEHLVRSPRAYLLGLMHKMLSVGVEILKFAVLIVIGTCLVFKYWVQMLYELTDEMTQWATR